MALVTYIMKTNGGTVGKSGTFHRYKVDEKIEAEEGEFIHLGGGDYEVVKKTANKPKATTKRKAASKPKTQNRGTAKGENRDLSQAGDDETAEGESQE